MTDTAGASTDRTIDADKAWAAVASRDRAADGTFVYAVTSTGVYCRPSCPSRQARRDRVRFFATPADAEAAGFRACLRCDPRRASRTAGESRALDAAAIIESRFDEPLPLAALAAEVGLSPGYLQRVFTRLIGRSPRAYQAELRTEDLRRRLKAGEQVATASYAAGFGSSRGAYESATPRLGMPPGAYRRGGAGLTIRYAIVPSPLGLVLAGVTQAGVCAVMVDDSEAALTADLRAEFPNAALTADPSVADIARQVVAYAAGTAALPDVQLDLQGTDFQRRVWRALSAIPRGATATYAEVARRIGEPTATRAVAGACASNHVAVLVPCHRVVRSDGGLGGYKWGVERKRRLIEGEGTAD